MICAYSETLTAPYRVEFDTWEEAYEVVGKILEKLNREGRISILDLNPNQEGYLKEYGWTNPFEIMIYQNRVTIRKRLEFFGDYESVDLLELPPTIIDILRKEKIDYIWQISDTIKFNRVGKLPIHGVGPAYSEVIRNAYEKYQLKSVWRGEKTDGAGKK